MNNQLKKRRINKIILNKNNSIFQAIKKLNSTNYQVCLVLDKKNKLLGTITDGDIRRAIIQKVDFKSSVNKIMNRNPIFVQEDTDINIVKSLMKKKSVLQIPVVNKKKEVINLIIWKDEKNFNNPKVIIMAGGIGKRMRPLTAKLPKPMIKIRNKPILEHIIIKLRSQGFKDIILSVRYLNKKIKNYFKNGEKFGVKINYITEKKILGTAGSLSLINPKSINNETIVINADTIFNLSLGDLIDFHKQKKSLMTMAIRQETIKSNYGIIEF